MSKVQFVFQNYGNGQYRNQREEGFIQLSETIIEGIQKWTDKVAENPTKKGLEEALETFTSKEYAAISMGHGDDALERFLHKLDLTCGKAAS